MEVLIDVREGCGLERRFCLLVMELEYAELECLELHTHASVSWR